MAKINLNYVLYNEKCENLIENEEPVRARHILANTAFFANQQETSVEDSMKLAALHYRLKNTTDSEMDLDAETICLLKKALKSNGKFCGYSGQIAMILEGKNPREI